MTEKDLFALEELVSSLPDVKVMIHSPWQEQLDCLNKYFSNVSSVGIKEWNLLEPSNIHTDILIICDVLMYVPNPRLAIENARASCKTLIIQDLMNRQRGVDSEFGSDGDCMRFSFNGEGQGFSLDYLNPIYYKYYDDNGSKQFIMMI